jgi:glycosyltransferase involved in cell wall biosynthesis
VLAKEQPDETFVVREIDALRSRGWHIDLIGLDTLPAGRSGHKKQYCDKATCLFFRRAFMELPYNPFNTLRLLRHLPHFHVLEQKIKALSAPRLHAHFAWLPADLADVVATVHNIPWSCSVHAWDVFTRPLSETRRRLKSAQSVVACTRAAQERVINAGILPQKTLLARHGWHVPSSLTWSSKRNNTLNILSVGRLVPKKGFDTLIAACAILKAKHITFACQIIGSGPEKEMLSNMISKLKLDACVFLKDHLPVHKVLNEISKATVLVLPSRRLRNGDQDGFANVLTESMALGTPVITTTESAAPELIEDGVNGILVPANAPELIAEAIMRISKIDAATLKSMVEKAYQTIRENMDESTEIAKLIKIFQPS